LRSVAFGGTIDACRGATFGVLVLSSGDQRRGATRSTQVKRGTLQPTLDAWQNVNLKFPLGAADVNELWKSRAFRVDQHVRGQQRHVAQSPRICVLAGGYALD
jgi:hypothetical protein